MIEDKLAFLLPQSSEKTKVKVKVSSSSLKETLLLQYHHIVPDGSGHASQAKLSD
jgi:hypothetical protein